MITRRTPIMGNGSRKMPANTQQNGGPLPVMNSLRAPESRPLTVRSAISQGIARRRVGNLSVDQKEILARQATGASSDDHAAHRFSLKQRRSRIHALPGRAPKTQRFGTTRRRPLRLLGLGEITISTSWPSMIRKRISRSLEKCTSRLLMMADTFG